MLVGNDVRRDPRVQKEARTLSAAGLDVAVIGLTYKDEDLDWETFEGGYRVRRVRRSGPIRQRLKSALRKVSPEAYDELTKVYRRVRGIPEKPRPKSAAPLTPEQRIAASRASMLAAIATHKDLSIAMAQAAIFTRPKVVHAHDLDTLEAGVWAARATGAALVFDSHEIWWAQHPPGDAPEPWVSFYQELEERLIRRADRVITVCDSIADFFAERYSIAKPAVVRNALEVPPGGFLREEALHPSNQPLQVLYHGGYMANRGLEELIDAAAGFQGAKLVMRGFGATEQELKNRVATLGVEDRVAFEAPVPMNEVVAAASQADIGIIPYRANSLNNRFATPNKLFEYMSAGLALAVSDLPELGRIVRAEQIGGVLDPDQPASIRDAINALARDPDQVLEMRRGALRAARERYNWGVEQQVLLEAYRALLERPLPARLRRIARGS